MREIWEKEGYTVKGAALAGIAVDNLQQAAGIKSRTLASYELAWNSGRDPLTRRDVLVIDEAGMLGTRQLEHVLRVAEKAHAKSSLSRRRRAVRQPSKLAPRFAASPPATASQKLNRSAPSETRLATRCHAKLKFRQNRRRPERLRTKHSQIIAVETRDDARRALIARWAHDHKQNPSQSQLVMAFTRDDVKALNVDIRTLRQQNGELGVSHTITTETGKKPFAANDRIRFLRNERRSRRQKRILGLIEGIEHGVLSVKLDGLSTRVHVDTKFYKHLDYGYAATVHKAQGTTVDRSYVLASAHFDRHTAYVALSRHRDNATVFYARDDFGGRGHNATDENVRQRFVETLSRARPKELAHDYLEREPGSEQDRLPPCGQPVGEGEKCRAQATQAGSLLNAKSRRQTASRRRTLGRTSEQITGAGTEVLPALRRRPPEPLTSNSSASVTTTAAALKTI